MSGRNRGRCKLLLVVASGVGILGGLGCHPVVSKQKADQLTHLPGLEDSAAVRDAPHSALDEPKLTSQPETASRDASQVSVPAFRWDADGPPVRWRRDLGQGYSSVVVQGDRLILFYREEDHEIIECADAGTGQTVWTYGYPTSYAGSTSYSNGPYSTPVANDRSVYAWGAQGRFTCLDLDDGSEVWHRNLSEEYAVRSGPFPVASSPLLLSDRLILNVGGRDMQAGVVALDCDTGETIWTATSDGASCASPVIASMHGKRVVFVWTEQHLSALDPETGQVWWQIPFQANDPETIHASSPVVYRDMVLVSGYQLGCLCVRTTPEMSCEELWRGEKRTLDSQYNNLTCRDGYVYGFPTVGAGLRCVEMETGRLMWKWKSRMRKAWSIAVTTNSEQTRLAAAPSPLRAVELILFDDQARLASVLVAPQGCRSGSMTARGLLVAPCFNAPTLYNNLLFLRNDQEILCLDLASPN